MLSAYSAGRITSNAGALKLANSPLRLSRTPGRARGSAPLFGQDTRDVLGTLLGLRDDEVDALTAEGVVHTEGGPNIEEYLRA